VGEPEERDRLVEELLRDEEKAADNKPGDGNKQAKKKKKR
jgi:hypothetical protein